MLYATGAEVGVTELENSERASIHIRPDVGPLKLCAPLHSEVDILTNEHRSTSVQMWSPYNSDERVSIHLRPDVAPP